MLQVLARLELTGLSTWLREYDVAFFSSLILHSLAMGFVVGINIAISLRVAGFAPSIALAPLRKFYPLHWFGVIIIVISGCALLLAYPAKALTNPVFYLKLFCLITALLISRYFQNRLSVNQGSEPANVQIRRLAMAALLLWVITIFAGRLLAYTNTVMLASRFF